MLKILLPCVLILLYLIVGKMESPAPARPSRGPNLNQRMAAAMGIEISPPSPAEALIGEMEELLRTSQEEQLSPAGQEKGERLRSRLRADPRAAWQAFRSILDRLPREQFATDRATLIALAVDWGPRAEVHELAREELKENQHVLNPVVSREVKSEEDLNRLNSFSPDLLPPLITHQTLLATSDSEAEGFRITEKAIREQRDIRVQKEFASQFHRTYPKASAKFEVESSK